MSEQRQIETKFAHLIDRAKKEYSANADARAAGEELGPVPVLRIKNQGEVKDILAGLGLASIKDI